MDPGSHSFEYLNVIPQQQCNSDHSRANPLQSPSCKGNGLNDEYPRRFPKHFRITSIPLVYHPGHQSQIEGLGRDSLGKME